MPSGTITKIVHLSLQSSVLADTSPQPKGYGFLKADAGGDDLYFAPKAVTGYSFDDLQVRLLRRDCVEGVWPRESAAAPVPNQTRKKASARRTQRPTRKETYATPPQVWY